MNNIRLFANCKCELSESPMYNKYDKRLYWRGFNGEIYRKFINDFPDDFECFKLNIGKIGSMVFTNSKTILLFGENGKIWKWIPYEKPKLYKDFKTNLFNDVITDKNGRVLCGVLGENYFEINKRGKHGSLWKWEKEDFICLDSEIGATPNGIRFSSDFKKLYLAVTDDDCIYEYSYELNSGKISNKKIFSKGCCPDGITVDSAGNLWVTDCRKGGPLICYNSDGKITNKLYFDTYRIISVAFGGENNDLMFVTTGCKNEIADGKNGGVFVVENAGIGMEEYVLRESDL